MPIKSAGIRALIATSFAALLLSACATMPYEPAELDSIPFRDRTQTQVAGQVTVSVAGPVVRGEVSETGLLDRETNMVEFATRGLLLLHQAIQEAV